MEKLLQRPRQYDGQATDIPAHAFRIAGSVMFGSNGESAETVRFRILARSAAPIEHWYWGRIVHQLDGARVKGQPVTEPGARINIDYGHDDRHVIGFANRFEIDDVGLWLSGALTPMPEGFNGEDMARRVIHLAKNDVPLEASINFAGSGVKIRELAPGELREVNGLDIEGPGLVVEEWPLRNCAICSLGADAATETRIFGGADASVAISLIKPESSEMAASSNPATTEQKIVPPAELQADEQTAAETSHETAGAGESSAPAELSTDSASGPDVDPPAADHDSAEAGQALPAVDAQLAARRTEGARFTAAFGEGPGSLYFTQGLGFAEATIAHLKAQNEELETLRQKLSAAEAAGLGVSEPVSFGDVQATNKAGIVPRRESADG